MAVKIRLKRIGEKKVKVDIEAAKEWIANGAQPTTVVKKLFKQAGLK